MRITAVISPREAASNLFEYCVPTEHPTSHSYLNGHKIIYSKKQCFKVFCFVLLYFLDLGCSAGAISLQGVPAVVATFQELLSGLVPSPVVA